MVKRSTPHFWGPSCHQCPRQNTASAFPHLTDPPPQLGVPAPPTSDTQRNLANKGARNFRKGRNPRLAKRRVEGAEMGTGRSRHRYDQAWAELGGGRGARGQPASQEAGGRAAPPSRAPRVHLALWPRGGARGPDTAQPDAAQDPVGRWWGHPAGMREAGLGGPGRQGGPRGGRNPQVILPRTPIRVPPPTRVRGASRRGTVAPSL